MGDENRGLYCGEELLQTGRGARRKFCSEHCRVTWWNRKRAVRKAPRRETCLRCGKALKPGRKADQRFCCRDCYVKWQYESGPQNEQKICAHCSNPFQGAPGRQYCGTSCANKARWQENPPTSACLHCGNKFNSGFHTYRLFCSAQCQRDWFDENGENPDPMHVREDRAAAVKEQTEKVETQEPQPKIAELIRLRAKGYCYREIGEIMGISINTVKSWGYRYLAQEKRIARGPALKTKEDLLAWQKEDERLAEEPEELIVPRPEPHVFLVHGYIKTHHGIENLLSIIQYRLGHDPFCGNLYVFCFRNRKTLKAILWDGGGFQVTTRTVQVGKYPWLPQKAGLTDEITKEAYERLLTYQKWDSPRKILTKRNGIA